MARSVLDFIACAMLARAPARGDFAASFQLPNTMRCLTNSVIHKWLAGQGMHHQPLEAGVPCAGDFPSPADGQDSQALGQIFADLLAKDGNKLVEILPGPGPGPKAWAMLDGFRADAGEDQTVISTPGHLFKGGDREAFRALLDQLTEFRWTFYIYAAPSRTILRVGGNIGIWSLKKGPRNELGRQLAPEQAA